MLVELLALALVASTACGEVLASASGPMHLGDGGAEARSDPRVAALPLQGSDFELAFELSVAKHGVKVRLELVEGLQRSDEAAPGVFLDNWLLGPIRREHDGRAWESPFVLDLSAGVHRVRLESWPKDADDFVWKGLKVYTGGLLQEAVGLPAQVPVKAAPAPALPCPQSESLPWPPRLRGGSLALSVLSGREAASGPLATLAPGKRFLARFKVPKAPPGLEQLPLLLQARDLGGRLELRLQVDEAARGKPNAPLGYLPGRWNPLELDWCGERLRLKVGESALELAIAPGPKELEIKVKDVELALDRRRGPGD